MENINLLIKHCSLLLFACTSFLYLASFPTKETNKWLNQLGHLCFAIGLILLAWVAFRNYNGRVWADSSGLLLTLFVGVSGLIVMIRTKMYSSGAFFAPLCTLILLLENYLSVPPSSPRPSHSLQNILAGIHVLTAVLGEALIIVACVHSAAYLRRRRHLRQKNFTEIKTSSFSLDTLESQFNSILRSAFFFVSLSLISGAFFTQLFITEMHFLFYLKIVWAFSVWAFTLALILMQRLQNWPFRRIAGLSFVIFFLLAISFFGLTFSRWTGSMAS